MNLIDYTFNRHHISISRVKVCKLKNKIIHKWIFSPIKDIYIIQKRILYTFRYICTVHIKTPQFQTYWLLINHIHKLFCKSD